MSETAEVKKNCKCELWRAFPSTQKSGARYCKSHFEYCHLPSPSLLSTHNSSIRTVFPQSASLAPIQHKPLTACNSSRAGVVLISRLAHCLVPNHVLYSSSLITFQLGPLSVVAALLSPKSLSFFNGALARSLLSQECCSCFEHQ